MTATESKGFSVTFERWTDEDVEAGDTDDRGFVCENVSLRDAIEETGKFATETNEWPVRAPNWFTFSKWNDGTREFFEDGVTEDRALHVPNHVTDASRRRIARLLGIKVS